MRRLVGLLVLAPLAGGPAAAEEWPVHGFFQVSSAYRLVDAEGCPPTQRLACEESFLLGEGRLRLEVSPRGDRWALLAKGELILDAVEGEVDVALRESYLDVRFPALDLRLGRQVITWGVGDLIFINDVFPKDWTAFIAGLPLEYLKKGSDAVSATGHVAGASIQLVLIPRFEDDTVPEAGGRFRFNDPAAAIESRWTDQPSGFDDVEVGLRVSGNVRGWDLSFYAYRGFFHSPAGEPEPGPRLRLFFPPLSVYGASAQGAAMGGVVSLEAGYYDSRSDRSGRNPLVENPSTRLLVGYQREVAADFTVTGQYSVQVMRHYDQYRDSRLPGMAKRSAARHVVTLRLTQLLLHQTLRLGAFALVSPNEGDWHVGPEAHYQLTDALSATVGVSAFGGPHRTDVGQFQDNSNLHAVVRYAF